MSQLSKWNWISFRNWMEPKWSLKLLITIERSRFVPFSSSLEDIKSSSTNELFLSNFNFKLINHCATGHIDIQSHTLNRSIWTEKSVKKRQFHFRLSQKRLWMNFTVINRTIKIIRWRWRSYHRVNRVVSNYS